MSVVFAAIRFSSRSNLSRHNRIVHKKEKYVCPVCQKAYTRKDSINGHIRTNHKGLSTNLQKAKMQHECSGTQRTSVTKTANHLQEKL